MISILCIFICAFVCILVPCLNKNHCSVCSKCRLTWHEDLIRIWQLLRSGNLTRSSTSPVHLIDLKKHLLFQVGLLSISQLLIHQCGIYFRQKTFRQTAKWRPFIWQIYYKLWQKVIVDLAKSEVSEKLKWRAVLQCAHVDHGLFSTVRLHVRSSTESRLFTGLGALFQDR